MRILTGNAEHEEVLRRYCEVHCSRWDALQDPRSTAFDSEHRFDCYVEPHYGIATAGRPDRLHETSRRELAGGEELQTSGYTRIAGGLSELVEKHIAVAPTADSDLPWLCLAEDAGAGKTVFSIRLQAFLSSPGAWQALSQGKPWLAVRIEQWPPRPSNRKGERYRGIKAAILHQLHAASRRRTRSS